MKDTHGRSGRIDPRHLMLTVAGIVAIVAASWLATMPSRDLIVRERDRPPGDTVPVTYVVPPAAADVEGGVPGVVIAHGFASARQIMMGYAWKLAYAGYAVALLDFGGHGANGGALDQSRGTLQEDLDVAVEWLLDQPEVDPARVAIAGHSMGSGAAMTAGIRRPELYRAVVAISPTSAEVTPGLPANLQLQAGSWEPRFLENAEQLLVAAGGASTGEEAFRSARARELVEVPRSEHISILFSDLSQQSLLEWMTAAFGPLASDTGTVYRDRRPLFALAFILGWVLLAMGFAPAVRGLVPEDAGRGRAGLPALRARWWWIGMIAGPAVATGALAVIATVVSLSGMGGMLVAGPVAVWFLIAGTIWLAMGVRPAAPGPRTLAIGIAVFAVLWTGVGLAAQQLALRWFLIPSRLLRWPVAALALVPWFLAAGYADQRASGVQRLGLFFAQSAVIVAGLGGAGLVVPGLFIIVLVLPAIPVVLAAIAAIGSVPRAPWSYAIGGAGFLGWLLVALFPLAG